MTRNLELVHARGEDVTIRHLVMPEHVECCTFPVLDWIKQNMPDTPVNVMDQYRPENFCDPHGAKYDDRHADIARRVSRDEVKAAYRYARDLGLCFEDITFEKNTLGMRL